MDASSQQLKQLFKSEGQTHERNQTRRSCS